MVIVLDTTPLSLVTHRQGHPRAEACRQWVQDLLRAGHQVLVPEIADYELRREFARKGNLDAIWRLDQFNQAGHNRFIPIHSTAMRKAAQLWGATRRAGVPTASDLALDGDVILAAQALTLALMPGVPHTDIWVASQNVRHLSRFVAAEEWENIRP